VIGLSRVGLDHRTKEIMNKNTIIAALLAGTLAVGVSGCSKDDDKPKADKSPSGSESVDPGRVSPTDLPTPPTVQNEKGAITDLTLGDCATDAGQQTVSGELTSSANKAQDFLVTVSWTTAANDVMGRGFKVFQNLAPGETVEFKITAKVADGATQCVQGVSYGVIKG
jgi:hypothetical protein